MATDTEYFDVPSDERPRGTFSRRLAFAFATVAAVTALLATVLLSVVWNYQFDQYVRGNLQPVSDAVAQLAAEGYEVWGGWTIQALSVLPQMSTTRGLSVQVFDESGNLIYDDSDAQSAEDPDGQTAGAAADPQGPAVTAPVVVGGQVVGTVRVWAHGTGAVLTERDVQFRQGSFTAVALAAIVAIVFASIAGVWYARRLVRPIASITAAARSLRQGDREARTALRGDDEISVLGATFDEMADAIEADRQLERRLTADVAHELRTPLQAIQATVEAMQDNVLPADAEHLGIVRNETMRLGRLADAILELTRLERGSLPFTMQEIDAADPVRAAVDASGALIESRDLAFSIDITEGLTILGDTDRLQQAVGNLISNAARYTPAGGQVRVSVVPNGSGVEIAVEDTGCGIAEDDLPHVFSRFWRADSARTSATGGLGIGLAVTKEIVERHRGTIGVRSVCGEGTRFSIRLPRAPKPTAKGNGRT